VVSAWEWDNIKSYNEETQTITITNALGLGEKITEIKLNTPVINGVPIGKDRLVAEMTFNVEDNYLNAINQIDSYNVKNNLNEIQKEYIIKKKIIKRVLSIDGITYADEISWEIYDSKDLDKGEITLGLFTDVKEGDYVEWIPELFGERIDEWATYYGFKYQEWASDLTTHGEWSYAGGMKFNVTSADLTIFNVTVDDHLIVAETVNITLWNHDRSVWLTSAPLVGYQANVTYNLTFGESYWLTTPPCGGCNHAYSSGETYPKDTGNVTWIKGLNPTNGGEDTSSGGYDILGISVGFVTSASADISVALISPADDLETSNSSLRFDSNATIVNGNLTNATLYVWNPDNSLFGTNTTIRTGDSNSTNLSISSLTMNDSYLWNVEWCGNNGTVTSYNCSFASANRTFSRQPFAEIAISFNNYSFETQAERFEINLSTISNIVSITGSLIHNGSSYPAKATNLGSGKYSLSRVLDMPLVNRDLNVSFHWKLDITDSTGTSTQNSTIRTQNINNTQFVLCNASITTTAVNFTVYNETNRTPISSTFAGTFNWYLGNGTVVENSSYSSSTNTYNNHTFCINVNKTFNTDSLITIDNAIYNKRTYSFNNILYSNVSKETHLFLNDAGTIVILEVKDAGLTPLQGYFIEVYRYYPGTNKYELVESHETDIYGQGVGRLIENDVKYNFIIKDENNVIKKETEILSVACRSTSLTCVLPFVIEDTTDYTERFFNQTDFEWDFTFSNDTNRFTFTWNDLTGDFATNRLFVQRRLFNGTTTVCNITSSATFGSLICDVGDSKARYVAQVFRDLLGHSEDRIAVINTNVGEIFGTFGKEGLMWGFILLFTLVGVGAFNPSVAVTLYFVGLIGLGSLGIISFASPIFWANLAIGVVFVWAFRS